MNLLSRHRFLLMAIATVLALPVVLTSASLATEVLIFALAALGTSTLCLSIILLPRMQALTLYPGAPIALLRRELWILVTVTGVCGLAGPLVGMFVK